MTVTLLVYLAAALALSLAGCGSATSNNGTESGNGNEENPDENAAAVDNNDPNTYTQEEKAAADPAVLEALEELLYYSRDLEENTDILLKKELKRAEQRKEVMREIEVIGREQIELARKESVGWSVDNDPQCEDEVGFPPYVEEYGVLPPYDDPFDWRAVDYSDGSATTGEAIDGVRGNVATMEKELEANPSDPLVDESEFTIEYAEKQIARAEDELTRGKELQDEVRAQEKRNEELYEQWEEEYRSELYDGLFCG